MYRGSIINSWQDLQSMTNLYSHASEIFDNELKPTQKPTKAAYYYETAHSSLPRRSLSPSSINKTPERAKSADHFQISLNEIMPMASAPSSIPPGTLNDSAKTTLRLSQTVSVKSNNANGIHSSTVYIEELHKTEKECEKRELNTLNTRFENYLEKIKHLANVNSNLHRQVDDAYRKYMGFSEEQHTDNQNKINSSKKYQNPYENKLNNLRQQINNEVRLQTSVQIRLQRAEYDNKFYQTNIKLLNVHEQQQSERIRALRQKLEVITKELEQIKQQYENREQDLQIYKTQYSEYINKLIQYSNEYDQVAFERMENENQLCTLKEQLVFEQEYHHRRQQEFEYLEKFQFDLNKEFAKNEFHYIVQQIRKDYQELNDIRLTELENSYKAKLEIIRNEISKREKHQQELPKANEIRLALDSAKQEYRAAMEQNQLLTDKLKQLEIERQTATELNHQRYEITNREYQGLQRELSELDCTVVHARENAGSLWSEINTYRNLLLNLLTPSNEKPQKPSRSNSPPKTNDKIKPSEKFTTSTTTTPVAPPPPPPKIENKIQESNDLISMVKPMINQVTKTTVGTKAKSPQQYRDETTGFIVHIEDGIIWVRI